MTQQIINVGNVANDGTGESLRSAFQAVNDNFSNVWAAGPVDRQVVIRNNVVTTNVANQELVLSANGIGTITVNSTVVPGTDSVWDLGAANSQFDSVFARYYYGNAAYMSGLPEPANLLAVTTDILPVASMAFDIGSTGQRWNGIYARDGNFSRNVTIGGNLTVMGDVIEMGNTVTDSLTINLANSATTPAAADGAGITVGSAADTATLLYDAANNVWTTNIGIAANGPITGTSLAVSDAIVYGNLAAIDGNFTGNVSADYFIGNGSLLTGISTTPSQTVVDLGDVGATFTVDLSAGGIQTANISVAPTVTLTGAAPGKVVLLLLRNISGTNRAVTSGVAAANTTTGAATYTVNNNRTGQIQYVCVDSTVGNVKAAYF